MTVICFSMDRVFQLSEYLRTLHEYVSLHGRRLREDPSWASISIICRCSDADMVAHYQRIAERYPHVTFLFEQPERRFGDCLLECLATTANSAQWLIFNVDDAFYFDTVELSHAISFLRAQTPPSSAFPVAAAADKAAARASTPATLPVWHFGVHLKLAPSLWRSHMTNQAMLPLPSMQLHASGTDWTDQADTKDGMMLLFDPAKGVLDWNYPWDLSGSLYQRRLVVHVVKQIQLLHGPAGVRNPNYLELRGHQIVQQWIGRTHQFRCGAFPSPKMHVMAINQVQDTFDNPLYAALSDNANASLPGGELTDLLQYHLAGKQLCDSYYRDHVFDSVHIGTLVLQSPQEQTNVAATGPLVSIIIPAFNAERYVEAAIRSIMVQTYANLEILVVDDASTDRTREIVSNLSEEDARIRLVCNEINQGVARTLNRGFALAMGDLLARMDADDIALSRRIQQQVQFLHATPSVGILGTAIVLGRDSASQRCEAVIYPTTPALTHWRMLFGCFLAHPSVMFRRCIVDQVVAADGFLYDASRKSSEDYDLWMRCLYQHNIQAHSLGEPLLWYRKHAAGVSTVQRERQNQETVNCTHQMIEKMLASSVPLAHVVVAVANAPPPSASVEDMAGAVDVIEKLVQQFVQSEAAKPSGLLDCERAYIVADAAARQGELALRAMVADPIQGSRVWSAFAARHPQVSRQAFQKLFGPTSA
ncbi:TPA: hypothetical protein N0F65_001347 [Lagenidium giganteum]|uniref:Glycosyltransferase 2-like domain-containing protein n=1 Tax=Lagenidium giganteum TaxID=4803 RepID=A0AAV2YZX3_9STRA|nr:TPA: hypothetical protein N0F65_001347 [Lagenidium giganteum]